MNYYKHHIGDFDADTSHLSWTEDAAYRRLMCLYYRREAPIPADVAQACRLIRATEKQQREAVDLVLREFFVLRDDGWHNKRCDEEIDASKNKASKSRENGKSGGRPTKRGDQTEPSGNPAGFQEETQQVSAEEMPGLRHARGTNSHKPIATISEAIASGAAAPIFTQASPEPETKPMTTKERIWLVGVPLLGEGSRGLIGKLARDHGEESVLEVLVQATLERPIEPRSWVVAACEAKAKARPKTNGNHPPDLLSDPTPAWAVAAGFANRFMAENAGCTRHNAQLFRGGKRV